MQAKTQKIMVSLEPALYELVNEKVLANIDSSASAYLRSLLIEDLLERGFLDAKSITDLFK